MTIQGFDYARFDEFCSRGFCNGKGSSDGQVCVEVAIALCAGEPFSDRPTCVHPVIRRHAIRLNDSDWSSPEARAKGMREYGLAQLGTSGIDGVAFARRLALLTATKLLPKVLRLVGLLAHADACEVAQTLEEAMLAARSAQNEARRKCAAYASYVAYAAAYAAASADASAAASYVAYADADAAYAAADAASASAARASASAASGVSRDRILTLGAALATQAIRDVQAGVQ